MPELGPARFGDRGDIGGHISTEPRINDRIRVPEVRLVGPSGEQVGIVSINDALRLAQEADLDLVEVAPTARPPVAKLMDFGKFKYESALKARESRKNQAQTVIKEIKIRPKIDPHDYGTKKGHVERFLRQGDKVKVTIMFRGREQSRPELGYKLLQRLAGDVEELGFVESQPKQDGRNMIMVIGPHRKKTDAKAARTPERASARASAPASQDRAASAPPRAATPARPASRPAPASAASASQRPEPRTTSPRPASGSGQAAPRPGPPRPGPGASGSPGAAASAAPKPAPPGSGARPSAKPGPSGA
ncbi:MAG: translation initiation factor IF-3, partial [Nocardiopsaceae bacterium]|nr:translation initiation factor IF-3 [Nocardiopsaceae bacterium]